MFDAFAVCVFRVLLWCCYLLVVFVAVDVLLLCTYAHTRLVCSSCVCVCVVWYIYTYIYMYVVFCELCLLGVVIVVFD